MVTLGAATFGLQRVSVQVTPNNRADLMVGLQIIA